MVSQNQIVCVCHQFKLDHKLALCLFDVCCLFTNSSEKFRLLLLFSIIYFLAHCFFALYDEFRYSESSK